jgi:hypothetical protein
MSRGLKPMWFVLMDIWANAQAYLRDKVKDIGKSCTE